MTHARSNPASGSWHAASLGLALALLPAAALADDFRAGPIFDQFTLTLDSGRRAEALGPLFYFQEKPPGSTWAIPPLLSYDTDPGTQSSEFDLLYPLLTCEHFGKEYRWQLIQLLSFSGGRDQQDVPVSQFTLFPLYFHQSSPDPNQSYTALFPLYGRIRNRLFRDELFFVLFPLYGESRKRDIVTDNYLYPIVHFRHGDGLRGWQAWPLIGREHKLVTTRTNGFSEIEIVPGYDKSFFLWPLYLHVDQNLGTENPEKFRASIPFYAWSRSPQRDSTTVLWPIFSWIDDRQRKYREWEGPWPLVVITRGEGKTTTRFLPLFSRSHNDIRESDSYLWPVWRYDRLHSDALDRERTRVLFYLFSDVHEQNTETGAERKRIDFWPLFVWHREFNGNRRLQILAPVEVALPNNRGIERNWSPLWSVWRSEDNPRQGAASQSLLWNLYRRDTTADTRKCSLLFGFFQYQSDAKMKKLRLFYLPVFRWPAPAKPAAD